MSSKYLSLSEINEIGARTESVTPDVLNLVTTCLVDREELIRCQTELEKLRAKLDVVIRSLEVDEVSLYIYQINPGLLSFKVHLSDGRSFEVPYKKASKRLAKATLKERQHCLLLGKGDGIHWPDIDEDLSAAGLMRDFLVKKAQRWRPKGLWLLIRNFFASPAAGVVLVFLVLIAILVYTAVETTVVQPVEDTPKGSTEPGTMIREDHHHP